MIHARTAAATLLATALLLTGCSGDDETEAEGASTASSDATASETASGSAEAGDDTAATGDLTVDNFYDTIIEAQQAAGSYTATGTTTTAGVTFEQVTEVSYEDGELYASTRTTPDSPQQLESVVAAGILYVRSDLLPTPGGKWLKIDPEDPAVQNSPFGGLASLADPASALQALADPTEVSLIGTETVEGVETQHYRVVASAASYVDGLGLPAETKDLLPEELPFDVWVDDEGRMIKQTQEATIQGQTTSSEQLFSDYGSAVDIAIPDDADTVGFDALGLDG